MRRTDSRILDYITSARKTGLADEETKKSLLSIGYDEDYITSAFAVAAQMPEGENRREIKPKAVISILILALLNAVAAPRFYFFIDSLFFLSGSGGSLITEPRPLMYLYLPYLTYLFLLVEILVASLAVSFISEKIWPGRKVLLSILTTFVLMQYLYLAAPNFAKQQETEGKSPTPITAKQYDFSKPVAIDAGGGIKKAIAIEGNKAVWFRVSGAGEVYRPTQIYLFEFAQEDSKGTMVQVSNNRGNDRLEAQGDKIALLNGKVYWLQNGGNLNVYDPDAQKTELLATDLRLIASGYKDDLLVGKASDYFGFGNLALYRLNTVLKHTDPIRVDVKNLRGMISSGQYICYDQGQGAIGRFNWETNETIVFERKSADPAETLFLDQCAKEYVLYAISSEGGESGAGIEWYKYDMDTKNNQMIKRLSAYSGRPAENKGVIHGNYFYYFSSDKKIYERNLGTGREKVLVSGNIDDWKIDDDSLLYSVDTSSNHTYSNALYLLEIH